MLSEETSKGFESRKCRARLEKFCRGTGVDHGCGDEKIVPGAIGVDRAGKEVNIAGDITNMYFFADNAFEYVFSSHDLEDQVDTLATHRGPTRESWVSPNGRIQTLTFVTLTERSRTRSTHGVVL